jgi:trigger factor
MEITKENVDELNAILKVRIEQEDYTEQVENTLKDYRKNLRMPGFRPGKVPAGIVKKLYGKSVLIEEIHKIISESVSKYLDEEKINTLGDPLPSENNSKEIDWDHQKTFEFEFDIGLAPNIEVNITNKDKIPVYEIQIDNQMIEETKENYARRFGTMNKLDEITGNEILKGDFRQVDKEGEMIEGGIAAESSSFSLEAIKDKNLVDSFIGKRADETVIFDVRKAFPNNNELASLLHIEKDHTATIAPNFCFTIKEISRFQKAELNKELYDKIYGKDVVQNEKEFTEKVTGELSYRLGEHSEYRFKIDAKDGLMRKVNVNLPEEFLKKWLTTINKEKVTEEQIEREYPTFGNDLKWQLIQNKIIKDNGINVNEDEVKEFARSYALIQFSQYGLTNVPDEQLNQYANDLLKNDEEKKKIYEKLYEEKVFDHIRENVKTDKKKITMDKFNKLFDSH